MDNTALGTMEFPEGFSNKQETRQPYYYIWAIVNGRLFVDGTYASEAEAIHFGAQKIKKYFEIEKLYTRDQNKATRIISHKYLGTTGDIDTVMKRKKHQI